MLVAETAQSSFSCDPTNSGPQCSRNVATTFVIKWAAFIGLLKGSADRLKDDCAGHGPAAAADTAPLLRDLGRGRILQRSTTHGEHLPASLVYIR